MFELAARYYDPQSSRQHAVSVLVHESGVVYISGLGIEVSCRLEDLRIAAPVLGDTLESLLLPSGAKCETLDASAVSRLRLLVGRRSHFDWVSRLEESWPAAVAATALVLGLLVSSYVWAIPALASGITRASPTLSHKIGQGTLSVLDLIFDPSELPEPQQVRIRGAFHAFALEHPELPLKLEFRKAGFANAFALPDGTIVLTDELVELSTHEAQVLGVLLHEIGHVALGHSMRRLMETSAVGVLALAYFGDADQVTAIASGLPALYATSRYSRGEETEADTAALEGMRRHGLEAVHFADMLRLLQREAGTGEAEKQYFSSHPATHERAERFDRAEIELD